MRGDAAARFLHDEVARRKVPIMLCGERHRGVKGAAGNQREAIRDGVARLDVHGRPGDVRLRGPGRMLECALWAKHAAAFNFRTRGDLNALAVKASAFMRNGREALARDWIVNGARCGPPVRDNGDRDREVWSSLQKRHSSVDRIDNEDELGAAILGFILCLFREPTIV